MNCSQMPTVERFVPDHTINESMACILEPRFSHDECRNEDGKQETSAKGHQCHLA